MNNYFSHDSNARNSDKLIPLRAKMGAEGYGIYFMILERLREESNYMSIKDYNMLAFDLRVDTAKVKAVVEEFGLFVFTDDGKYFYSESFLRRMKEKDDKSEKARKSALSRWQKNERTDSGCERIANARKNDAIKKRKGKKNIIPPIVPPEMGDRSEPGSVHDGCATATDAAMSEADASAVDTTHNGRKSFRCPIFEQVQQYCRERDNGIDPQEFIDFYASKGWMVGKSPMKDWRAAVRTWENRRKKDQSHHNSAMDYKIPL